MAMGLSPCMCFFLKLFFFFNGCGDEHTLDHNDMSDMNGMP